MRGIRSRLDRLERKCGKGLPYFNAIFCTENCSDCEYVKMPDAKLRECAGPGSHTIVLDMRGEHKDDPKPCPAQQRLEAARKERWQSWR